MDTAKTENYLPEDESKNEFYQDYYLQNSVLTCWVSKS